MLQYRPGGVPDNKCRGSETKPHLKISIVTGITHIERLKKLENDAHR
jgi:hypothetical protein